MVRFLGRAFAVAIALVVVLSVVLSAIAIALKTRKRSWGDEESDSVELVCIMDGLEFESHAKEFSGGSVFTMMGGAEIDLRRVNLSEHGAFLQVRTIMGGTEIVVPEGWRVLLDGTAVAGVNEKDLNDPDLPPDAPTLELDARTYLGALEISHAPMPVVAAM
jgi:predicted membrane protein